jgi:hypothetical protein
MRLAVISGILLTFAACGGDNSAPTELPLNIFADRIVTPNNRVSVPPIPTGGKVHFFNKDTAPHTIVATGTAGCASGFSSDGPIPPNGEHVGPTVNSAENCTLNDSANTALAFHVDVVPPAAGGGGSGPPPGGY